MKANRQWLDLGLDALPGPLAERVRLFRVLVASASALRTRLDRALADSGLTTRQGAVLQYVEAQPAPPAITEVAAALSMTHQNLRQIVDALARKGFLSVEIDAADRRVRRLVATERHHRFWNERNAADFERLAHWTAGLDDHEVRTLVALLAKMRRHLDTLDAPSD